MVSIAAALGRFKRDPLGVIKRSVVERSCREQHHHWRERALDPTLTIALFAQQIIHGNTPCSEVRHIAGRSFTASAWCQARARLPLAVYQTILSRVCEAVMPQTHEPQHLWRGHRTFHVDGSSFSMPDTAELRRVFGQPGGQRIGCGFPTAHLLVLFSAATGLIIDAFASPLRTGDVSQASEYLAHLNSGDILIGDDSFSGYAHFALLLQQNLHGIFPNHHRRIIDFTPGRAHTTEGKNAIAGLPRSRWIKSLGKEDQWVEWFKPSSHPAWMSREDYDALPESIRVREICRTVRLPDGRRITVTLVTTLLDPICCPADELIELRLRRWDVETNLRHLKTTMGLDVLHCKTELGVRKERVVFCLVYNLARVIMLQASKRQQASLDRISFVDTLKWMRHARLGDTLPDLIINPRRPHRIEPRCKKRRPKQYDLMTRPRRELQRLLKKQAKWV
jgi:hypothetical protein